MPVTLDNPILISTLFLTVVSLIGLVFFVKASVKDRTQRLQLVLDSGEVSILDDLKTYFLERAYGIRQINADQQEIYFSGNVSPSLFLAIFLTTMTALGLLCLALVIFVLWPASGALSGALILVAPLAGLFYWKQAGREEQIQLKVSEVSNEPGLKQLLTITAHRDELKQLQTTFALPWIAQDAH